MCPLRGTTYTDTANDETGMSEPKPNFRVFKSAINEKRKETQFWAEKYPKNQFSITRSIINTDCYHVMPLNDDNVLTDGKIMVI